MHSFVLLIARTIYLHPSNTPWTHTVPTDQLPASFTQHIHIHTTLPGQLTVRLGAHWSLHLLHAFFSGRARARHVCCCFLPSASGLSFSRFRHLDRHRSLLSLPPYCFGCVRDSLRCGSNADETLSLFREGEETFLPAASVRSLGGLFLRRGRC